MTRIFMEHGGETNPSSFSMKKELKLLAELRRTARIRFSNNTMYIYHGKKKYLLLSFNMAERPP